MNVDAGDYVSGIGQVLIVCSVLGALACILGSHRFLLGAGWILTLALAFLGARLVTAKDRNDLAQMRNSTQKLSMEIEQERDALEACRVRRERRDAIRAGMIKDDGLSDWGRELKTNQLLSESVEEFEGRFGVIVHAQEEDIFAVEVRDKKVEAAWKRVVAAQEAWEKAKLTL